MKVDRALAVLAVAIASAALLVSVMTARRDPLGTDVSNYDLSSPEKTLQSINTMVANQDLRAGWQLLSVLLESDNSPETKLFFAKGASIKVLKSIEVSPSASPKNVGLIVSFVNFTVSGVDYHTVLYFRKDQSNRFRLAEMFYVPYGTEKNDQDKALETAIGEFKKTGKI